MTKPASPTSFGFDDACEIAVAPYTAVKPFADKDEALKAAFAKVDAEVARAGLPSRPVLCAPIHAPFSDPLFDLSPAMAERHVRRALRNRDGN